MTYCTCHAGNTSCHEILLSHYSTWTIPNPRFHITPGFTCFPTCRRLSIIPLYNKKNHLTKLIRASYYILNHDRIDPFIIFLGGKCVLSSAVLKWFYCIKIDFRKCFKSIKIKIPKLWNFLRAFEIRKLSSIFPPLKFKSYFNSVKLHISTQKKINFCLQ